MWPFKNKEEVGYRTLNIDEIEKICRDCIHSLKSHVNILKADVNIIYEEVNILNRYIGLKKSSPGLIERMCNVEEKLDLLLDHLGLEAAMSEPSKLTLYEKQEE